MEGMSPIVKQVARMIAGFVFLYGCYIILHGHLTPGGGFAGGAILAGSFILLILAYGSNALKLRKEITSSSIIESLAIFMVVILGLAGLVAGINSFFGNFLPKGVVGELLSAGIIPLYNIFIGIEVAAAIVTIFLALVIFKEENT